jgi:DNA-directed RNA polymerase subunit RPC12/RpoP
LTPLVERNSAFSHGGVAGRGINRLASSTAALAAPQTSTLDVMLNADPSASVVTFQRRRSAVWKLSGLWALGLLPLFVTLPFLGDLQLRTPMLFWAIVIPLGGAAFFSAFRIVQTIRTRYKCPVCEKLVTEGDGIAVNPEFCPHCNARLSSRAPA